MGISWGGSVTYLKLYSRAPIWMFYVKIEGPIEMCVPHLFRFELSRVRLGPIFENAETYSRWWMHLVLRNSGKHTSVSTFSDYHDKISSAAELQHDPRTGAPVQSDSRDMQPRRKSIPLWSGYLKKSLKLFLNFLPHFPVHGSGQVLSSAITPAINSDITEIFRPNIFLKFRIFYFRILIFSNNYIWSWRYFWSWTSANIWKALLVE